MSRREFLVLGGTAYAGAVLAGCGRSEERVGPQGKEVDRAEAKRRPAGAPTREFDIAAAPLTLDLAGLGAATLGLQRAGPGA